MKIPRTLITCGLVLALGLPALAKVHSVALGAWRNVPYPIANSATASETKSATKSNAKVKSEMLHVRPLVVDGRVLDWTAGDIHEITDRTFVVRRAVRLNDALPGERGAHWIWTLGPWLMVDRIAAHITVVRLPDFDPAVSEAVWFRDDAAYCGLRANGKHLYVVVTELGVKRPLVEKALSAWSAADSAQAGPACASATWQRQPLQVTFHPTGGDAVSYQLFGLSSALVDEGESADD